MINRMMAYFINRAPVFSNGLPTSVRNIEPSLNRFLRELKRFYLHRACQLNLNVTRRTRGGHCYNCLIYLLFEYMCWQDHVKILLSFQNLNFNTNIIKKLTWKHFVDMLVMNGKLSVY